MQSRTISLLNKNRMWFFKVTQNNIKTENKIKYKIFKRQDCVVDFLLRSISIIILTFLLFFIHADDYGTPHWMRSWTPKTQTISLQRFVPHCRAKKSEKKNLPVDIEENTFFFMSTIISKLVLNGKRARKWKWKFFTESQNCVKEGGDFEFIQEF